MPLSDEQIKDAIKRCGYGGNPVDMSLRDGDRDWQNLHLNSLARGEE